MMSLRDNIHFPLKEIDTLPGQATLSKLFLCHAKKGPTPKGKSLLPVGANSLLLE